MELPVCSLTHNGGNFAKDLPAGWKKRVDLDVTLSSPAPMFKVQHHREDGWRCRSDDQSAHEEEDSAGDAFPSFGMPRELWWFVFLNKINIF